MHRYNYKWQCFEGSWKSGRKLCNIFRRMQPSTSSFISPHTYSSFFFGFRIGRNEPKAVLKQAVVRCRFFFFFSAAFTLRYYLKVLVAAGGSLTSSTYCLLIKGQMKALQIVLKSWNVLVPFMWKMEEDTCSFHGFDGELIVFEQLEKWKARRGIQTPRAWKAHGIWGGSRYDR